MWNPMEKNNNVKYMETDPMYTFRRDEETFNEPIRKKGFADININTQHFNLCGDFLSRFYLISICSEDLFLFFLSHTCTA